MITQSINLNLIPNGVTPIIKVSQYDKASRTLQFTLYNDTTEFSIPSGSTVTIQGTKKDGTGFQYSCTFSGSVVTANLEQQMTAFAGNVRCEIVITYSSQILGTSNFILQVEQAALSDDTVISDTELPLLQQAVQAVEVTQGYAEDAEAYAVGTRNGVAVTSGDPAYQHNSKYYADNFVGYITDAQWASIQALYS